MLFKLNWLLLLFIAALTLGLVIEDHLNVLGSDSFFFYGQVILIILLVLTAGLLLQLFRGALTDRSRRILLLDQKNELAARLAGAVDHQDVYRQIIQFASTIFPAGDAALYILDEGKRQLELTHPFSESSGPCSACGPGCLACLNQTARVAHLLVACPSEPAVTCLALRDDHRLVGMLSLQMPVAQNPTREQVELLEAVDNEIARTLAAGIEKKKRADLALSQAVIAAQVDIAGELRDTLAQNIAYLRKVLETMDEMSPLERASAGAEIRQMHAVAEESCDLVQGTLSVLQAGEINEAVVEDIFANHARVISERGGFVIRVSSSGVPVTLPSHVLRQLFYIFREALSNIQKHAQASLVCVDLLWEPDRLILTVTDNGVGFEPAGFQAGGHIGLNFMRTHVSNLRGTFSLHAAPGAGTSIIISLPVAG